MSFSKSAWLRAGDEDSDDEEIQDEQVRDRPDAICYLIECSASMHAAEPFEDDDGNERNASNISTAIRSALELMKTRIISGSPRDVIGIVLYDTTSSRGIEGELPKQGVYMLLEPSPIRAMNIKMLNEQLDEAEGSPEAFRKKFQPIDSEVKGTHLIEAMKSCETVLKNRSSNLSNRYLYLITDNDDPFQGNKQQQSVALVFANDAHESGFQIKTFFMPAGAAEDEDEDENQDEGDKVSFDLTKFWNRFRYDPSLDVEMDNASMVFAGKKRFEKLLSLSSEAGKTKRAMFTIPLFLWEGIALGVTGYAAIGEQRKKPPTNIEQAEEIKEVYFKTAYTEASTGDSITEPGKEIVKYASIGTKGKNEERIFFESEEVAKIKNLGMTPSLKLLGFMPRKEMKEQYTNKHSYLIYPNETQYTNSIPAFSALLKSMLKKDIVGLGVLIARSNSSPQLVYMLPQGEERDPETDVQLDPPCIWIIQIPFADDIREPTVKTCLSAVEPADAGDKLIDSYKKVIKKMRVEFAPHMFPNPVLQHHYSILAAIALQEDTPAAVDRTLPDTEIIAARAGSLFKGVIENISSHPGMENYTWAKRGTAGGTGGGGGGDNDDDGPSASKKPKVSKEKASQGIESLEKTLKKAFETDTSKKLTISTLKDYLKQKGLKRISTMKKDELLQHTKEQLVKDGLYAGGNDGDDE